MQLSSVDEHMNSSRRALTPAEHRKATRLYREMKLFSSLMGMGTGTKKSSTEPGSDAFLAAARKDYEEQLQHYGEPRFPAAFVVRNLSALPSDVSDAVDAFAKEHLGQLEVASNSVDGHPVYQVHVAHKETVWIALFDVQGEMLARASYTQGQLVWEND